jgi:hypothetical protein
MMTGFAYRPTDLPTYITYLPFMLFFSVFQMVAWILSFMAAYALNLHILKIFWCEEAVNRQGDLYIVYYVCLCGFRQTGSELSGLVDRLLEVQGRWVGYIILEYIAVFVVWDYGAIGCIPCLRGGDKADRRSNGGNEMHTGPAELVVLRRVGLWWIDI